MGPRVVSSGQPITPYGQYQPRARRRKGERTRLPLTTSPHNWCVHGRHNRRLHNWLKVAIEGVQGTHESTGHHETAATDLANESAALHNSQRGVTEHDPTHCRVAAPPTRRQAHEPRKSSSLRWMKRDLTAQRRLLYTGRIRSLLTSLAAASTKLS